MTAVTEHSPLPSRHDIRSVFEGLLGRTVEVADGLPVAAAPSNVLAVYVTDQIAMTAVAVLDLPCAARVGAALGMLPAGAADDAIAAGELPELIRDCCYEVLNVLASVFNVPDAPHVKLHEMYGPHGTVPSDASVLAATLGSREDLSLSISGYGDGGFSLVVQ